MCQNTWYYTCFKRNKTIKTILLTSGRTGSTLICDSLFKAGLPVKYEPLNEVYASKYANPDKPYINQEKIDAINESMKNAILCKVLYYQLNEELLKQLHGVYQMIHLKRSPVQVYMSLKIAEKTKTWHENNTDVPQLTLSIPDFNNFLYRYTYSRNLCAKYSFIEIDYTDMFNWDSFIHRFQNYLGIDPVYIEPSIKKSKYNKKEVITNYKEVMDAYVQFYNRLLTNV